MSHRVGSNNTKYSQNQILIALQEIAMAQIPPPANNVLTVVTITNKEIKLVSDYSETEYFKIIGNADFISK